MVQLNRSMMDRYEIADHRPQSMRAVLFGTNRVMLGACARMLHDSGIGALCVSRAAESLRAQDCMFTLLVRGDQETGGHIREEKVVQSIIAAVDPENEFDDLLNHARTPEIELMFLSGGCDALEIALAARFLYARFEAQLAAPAVILAGEHVVSGEQDELRSAMAALSAGWAKGEAFRAWLNGAAFRLMLTETLSGPLGEAECAKARHDMNYRDEFIAWAEPGLKCTLSGGVPCLGSACACTGFDEACTKKARVFDAAVFLCTALGFLCGKDTFAQVLKDERLRDFIGHAFFDEILPALPYAREEIAPEVISAFSRLENSMNDMPLLEMGRGMLHAFPNTVLPAVRAWADREFEAPAHLSLALSAAIMLYAGARRNEAGVYEVLRGDSARQISDDPDILEAFSRLSHDMPAESLAYAALADRAIWGADLREIDGLEMRVCFDLSSIQRVGLMETMRLRGE